MACMLIFNGAAMLQNGDPSEWKECNEKVITAGLANFDYTLSALDNWEVMEDRGMIYVMHKSRKAEEYAYSSGNSDTALDSWIGTGAVAGVWPFDTSTAPWTDNEKAACEEVCSAIRTILDEDFKIKMERTHIGVHMVNID